MPERGFDTKFWSDAFVQSLPWEGKFLFSYLWTNEHCNQSGLYEISLGTIAFETGIPQDRLPQFLPLLAPKVAWYPEHNIVWVKNFLRHQAKSPKFVIAAIKSLNGSGIPEDIRNDFEAYNEQILRGVAPSEHVSPTKRECVIIRDNFRCQYCEGEITTAEDYEMDHIIPVTRGGKDNYPNLVAACRDCNQKKLDKTPQEAGMKMPTAAPFHGAQATYILRNNAVIREKWLKVFPDRYKVIESILFNIGQHYSISLARASSASASAISDNNKKKRVTKGEEESTRLAEVAKVYEENIGAITPMIAEELKDIAENYPADWFKDAVAEAVKSNVRKLNYIEAILERWRVEGKGTPKIKDRPSRRGSPLPDIKKLRKWVE